MASPAHRKNLAAWDLVLDFAFAEAAASVPCWAGAESWVQLPFIRFWSFQPRMSSRGAMCHFTRNTGSNSVDKLLCCASFHKMFFMLSMRRMEIYNQEKNTLVYSAYLEISSLLPNSHQSQQPADILFWPFSKSPLKQPQVLLALWITKLLII